MKRTYTLTDEQFQRLMVACRNTPYLVIGGMEPLTPYDRAMVVWREIAETNRVDVTSIEPGSSPKHVHRYASTGALTMWRYWKGDLVMFAIGGALGGWITGSWLAGLFGTAGGIALNILLRWVAYGGR